MKKIRYTLDKCVLFLLVLFTFDTEKRQVILDEMNKWRYPSQFTFFKPKYFDGMKGYFRKQTDDKLKKERKGMCKYDFCARPYHYLKCIIGEKEWLRWHWKNNLKRTNEEFEYWWWFEKDML